MTNGEPPAWPGPSSIPPHHARAVVRVQAQNFGLAEPGARVLESTLAHATAQRNAAIGPKPPMDSRLSPATTARLRSQRSARRAAQHSAIATLGQEALAGTAPAALMERAVHLLGDVFKADIVVILEIEADSRVLRPRAVFGLEERQVAGRALEVKGDSLSSYVIQHNQPVVISDLATETRFRPSEILLAHGVVAGISVVIRGRTRPYGVLSLFHTRKRRFEREEASTLASAANVIGMAIERASTEEQLLNTREELLRLNNDLEHRVAARTTELEAAYREAEALSYSIAHDLRAPLRAISGYAKILEEELAPILPDQARNYLDRMGSNAERLGTLIDALLALQRLSRQPIARSPVRLNEAVEDALNWLRSEQPGRDIDIDIGDLGIAEVDPALMRLAFANLLSNAIKFTRGRSPARVAIGRIDRDGERIYFVEDNGAGFDMRFADKLFGVFQRLHPESEYEGSGIGLASVYRIITRHGGRIWAVAEVDRGATFFFTVGAIE
jgi:signal transduction histidine kinase